MRPIRKWHITSDFGWRWGKTHDGIDLGAPTGTPLYAMSKGEVIGSFYDPSFGNKIEIRYWDGSISWYGHLSKRIAQKGDTVLPGELVGRGRQHRSLVRFAPALRDAAVRHAATPRSTRSPG